MTTITFDTQQFVDTLKEANFSDEQARALSKAIKRVQQESDLVTKADLRELEHRLTLRMGAMFGATIFILTALDKLL
uniref:DUF1640 domain-containing protein n=3 Tax=unclassified Candidatus Kentrum TaxID=2643149 RepID=A0A451AVW7_9GAMM|nr:MAG: Protein of unknown function (DUF1640) [Candidatus Kentron sp. LPFa]VFK61878.1 MAG: Protein of unknown function (DUF1640) [Candidatus Kentron sp. UNK]VFK70037.1 MAG: Protein of unknown function (DUF1640) [Candidatus Kentron sp. UNK]VFK78796.1 MAG: Protein of unknown function (DUF1640) [Candidatus Kentron sp. SD]